MNMKLPLLIVFLAFLASSNQDAFCQTNTNKPPVLTVPESYLLRPQDKLVFRLEEDPVRATEAETLIVSALGQIYFPISRGFDERISIEASGKTVAQVEVEIRGKLEENYYQKATVKLALVDQSRRFGQALFMGAVRGPVPLTPGENVTLAEAIVRLGYSEFANLKKVEVYRLDAKTKKEYPADVIDVDAILKGNRSKDIPLQDGDRIVVPEKKFLF